ncbi:TPA: hypothetical protein ACH3X3_010532 [Trebouxia sp. C0006]
MKSYVPFSRAQGYEAIHDDATTSNGKQGLPRFSDVTQIEAQSGARAAFGISKTDLSAINENKDKAGLKQLGGLSRVAQALHTDTLCGVDQIRAGISDRQAEFGVNQFKELPQKSFWSMVFEGLQDPTLILLMAAALVSTVLGVAIKEEREQNAWSEGVAIWVAVIVVSLVGAGNDFQKDKQFRKLNAQKDIVEVTVVRGGSNKLIPNTGVVVGDVLVLTTGDKVTADGIVIESHGMIIDEASLTGEADPIKKTPEDPWVRSGTQVTEGCGRVLVLAVGVNSEWGRTMAMCQSEPGETPLQQQLEKMAGGIAKLGMGVAIVCFVVLMLRWMIQNRGFLMELLVSGLLSFFIFAVTIVALHRWMIQNRGFPLELLVSGPLKFFIFAVTIVVVAVPEGLPLAVTISLAYSMKKMMKDNNFVRVLAACETMGGATAICSDKTGTLTENRMTVVEGWFGGIKYGRVPAAAELHAAELELIEVNAAVNSQAFLVDAADHTAVSHVKSVEFVGNRTECALLLMLRGWGHDYKGIRDQHRAAVQKVYTFSSATKMASVLVSTGDDSYRLYVKGAPEYVLTSCSSVLGPSGPHPLTDDGRTELLTTVTGMASQGLRTLCLAYADVTADALGPLASLEGAPPQLPLTACCVLGIKDPVRKEVPNAVATCKHAGIVVRMVTGDNVHTAQHIARECGILTEGGLALEGPQFRVMPEHELVNLLPRLQVLARSSPTDKFNLVKLLKKQGEIVAVTGDGTNDAPALKESDVGLAMGIAGTEVAKAAADIVIMDDNFSSIVKSVLWGRSVFNNIRKFLQFQLTINFVALAVAAVAAVTNGETPLNVLQLLWVNLIMDAMAALALATENPTPELLLEKPHGRSEPLISRSMWRHVIVQGCYQLFWLFLIIYGASAHIPAYKELSQCEIYSAVGVSDSGIRLRNITSQAIDFASINLCCSTTGGSLPCDASLGGLYYPGETPICLLAQRGKGCTIQDTQAVTQDNFCPGSSNQAGSSSGSSSDLAGSSSGRETMADDDYEGDDDDDDDDTDNVTTDQEASNSNPVVCSRLQDFQSLVDHAQFEWQKEQIEGHIRSNSLVFNTFIFLQVFNSRKLGDSSLNVFKGITKSRAFMYVIIITVTLQIIIVSTPLATVFITVRQNFWEWLFALLVGAGGLGVSAMTKLITQHMQYSSCVGHQQHEEWVATRNSI